MTKTHNETSNSEEDISRLFDEIVEADPYGYSDEDKKLMEELVEDLADERVRAIVEDASNYTPTPEILKALKLL